MRYTQADRAKTEYRKKRDILSLCRYFDELKLYLLLNPIVESVEIISEKIGGKEGYLRIIIGLPDDSVIQCFEYALFDESIELSKYSFHWQDVAGNLICRWDNAPHHPELDNFPYHVHTKDKVIASSEMNLRKVLIEAKAVLEPKTR
ncbi:MAG: hypothetical protein CHKLHMKO_00301 [Candidatus Argoarchaeum ethanivorans]|uniref:Uncharacterized protein n=1 Tax=Candidatus Argoarchaeum ethanivorans TaxID=2608793 RepID=A0A811T5H1_9EURY|nr:MAG: hypothetical protein CHKLHMKO_00301 [Candidatus Argoarchaeum ethanivorans]